MPERIELVFHQGDDRTAWQSATTSAKPIGAGKYELRVDNSDIVIKAALLDFTCVFCGTATTGMLTAMLSV